MSRNPDLGRLTATVRSRLGVIEGVDLSEPIRGFTVRNRGRICEARSTDKIETREAGDGPPNLLGYASTYDDPYDIGTPIDEGGWGWTEYIMPGAAAKSIAENDDVYLFFDHDGLPLSATKDKTLRLSEDAIGLRSDGDVDPASAWSMEVFRRVQQRKLDRMSFAFQVIRERWEDRDGNEESWMTAPVRRILEVKLFDTSVVSFPANPSTTVHANSGGMLLAEAKAAMEALRSPTA